MTTAIATPRWSTLPGKPALFAELTAGNTSAAANANIAAINAASLKVNANGGGTVWIPDGLWRIKPSGGTAYLRAYSNVTVRGQSRESVLEVYSGTGDYYAVFNDTASTLTNWALRSLTIRQNPTGNTSANIRTVSQGAPDNNACQFGVAITGANCRNIRFIDTYWEDCCGVNTLWVNSTGGSRVRCIDNEFSFKRGPTTGVMSATFGGSTGYDASIGYFAARDVRGSGNVFRVDDYADFNGGCEIHGVEQSWRSNHFHGLYTAFSIVPPFTSGDNQSPSNVVVASNSINRAAVAIAMQLPAAAVPASKWKIHDNAITLYQAGGHHDSKESAGIWLQDTGATGGVLDGLRITENEIEFEPDTRATSTRYFGGTLYVTQDGILLSQRAALRNVKVVGNTVTRAPAAGIALGFNNAAAELTGVTAKGNETIDCGANPNNAAVNTNNRRCHYEITGLCSDVKVFENLLKDTGAGVSIVGLYGMRLACSASPTFSFAGNNRHQTALLPLLPFHASFGASLCGINYIDTLADGGTIAHQQMPVVRFAPTANRTGMLLTAGVYHEQRVTLFNEGSFTLTFAATGTYGVPGASNVAAGTAEVIGGKQARTFCWSSVVNQWFAER